MDEDTLVRLIDNPRLRNRKRGERRARVARYRAWINDYKTVIGCCECGERDPAVLDFHHRDAAVKEEAIGKLVGIAAPWDKIQSEIAKCVVVCANDHRRFHARAHASKRRVHVQQDLLQPPSPPSFWYPAPFAVAS